MILHIKGLSTPSIILLIASMVLMSCIEATFVPGTQTNQDATAGDILDTASSPQFGGSNQGVSCANDEECFGTGACISGKCKKQCETDDECYEGLSCKGFRCTLEGDTSSSAPIREPPDTKESIPDTGKEDIQPEEDSQASPEPNKGKAYGESCSAKSDCASEMCLPLTGGNMCTKECSGHVDCPQTDTCVTLTDNSTKVCIPNDSGNPCSLGCLSGLSLNNDNGDCICAAGCTDANKCPAGFACGLVATTTGNQKLCVKVGAPCNDATKGICFDKCVADQTGQGYCTAFCENHVDCPAGWLCDAGLSHCTH